MRNLLFPAAPLPGGWADDATIVADERAGGECMVRDRAHRAGSIWAARFRDVQAKLAQAKLAAPL